MTWLKLMRMEKQPELGVLLSSFPHSKHVAHLQVAGYHDLLVPQQLREVGDREVRPPPIQRLQQLPHLAKQSGR